MPQIEPITDLRNTMEPILEVNETDTAISEAEYEKETELIDAREALLTLRRKHLCFVFE